MQIGRVIGNVVATQKNGKLDGSKLMLVQIVDLQDKPKGLPVIAIDVVDAGIGDRVLLVQDGKAAMQALNKGMAGVDAAILGVIDEVDVIAD